MHPASPMPAPACGPERAAKRQLAAHCRSQCQAPRVTHCHCHVTGRLELEGSHHDSDRDGATVAGSEDLPGSVHRVTVRRAVHAAAGGEGEC